MRFLVIVKANNDSESGAMPTENDLKEMGKFNDELVKAGLMLAGEGVHPSSKGARIRFDGKNKPVVVDGPFAETKELLAGFWIVQMKSRAECIEWFKRAPFKEGELEIRPIFEEADFGDLAKKVPEVFAKEREFREQTAKH